MCRQSVARFAGLWVPRDPRLLEVHFIALAMDVRVSFTCTASTAYRLFVAVALQTAPRPFADFLWSPFSPRPAAAARTPFQSRSHFAPLLSLWAVLRQTRPISYCWMTPNCPCWTARGGELRFSCGSLIAAPGTVCTLLEWLPGILACSFWRRLGSGVSAAFCTSDSRRIRQKTSVFVA